MKKLIIFLLFAISTVFSQESKNISSFIINDELNINDPVDLKLGRYEAFEINIGAGDRLAIELSSDDFWPVLLLISPSKKSILRFPTSGNIVKFDTTIVEGGSWEFYVIGDTNAVGKYKCEVGFASKEVFHSLKNNDECSVIRFFLQQAEANFIFIRNKKDFEYPSFVRNVDFDNGEVKLNILTNEKLTPDILSKKLLDCLGDNWLKDSIQSGRDGFTLRLIENTFKNRKYISCSYSINSRMNGYLLTIGRE